MLKNVYLKLSVYILLIVTILGVAVGCGNKQAQHQDQQVIKVGYFPNITHAQALVGISDGTFQKALGDKVTIEEHTFNAGPSEIEALLAGEIDLGYIGSVPAINGFVKSKGDLKIIAGASDVGAILVARKTANIKSVKDLDGRKVAIPQLGNTQDISLRNLLSQANLKDASKGGTVTIVPADNPDILTLLSKSDIDAALVPEPWGSRIVKEAGADIVLDAKEVWRDGKYTTAVVIVRTKFLHEQPELVQKWLAAHVEITQRINQDKGTSMKTINSQIQKLTQKSLPEDVLSSSFERLSITYNPETESVQEFVKLAKDNGYIKGDSDVANIFELEPLNKLLQQKGLAIVE